MSKVAFRKILERRYLWAVLLLIGIYLVFHSSGQAATITWDGGGDGTSWNQTVNWAGDVLPGSNDDVVINMGSTITISMNVTTVINSLQCQENMTFCAGISLTIKAASQLNGALTMAYGAALRASGASASFNANGSAMLDSGCLYATSGGHINIPNATQYTHTGDAHIEIKADGAGSQIDLNGMTIITGGTRTDSSLCLDIAATNGGVINFPALTEIRKRTSISVTGTGSQINMPALVRTDGTGGGDYYPLQFTVHDHGSLVMPSLTTALVTSFYVYDGLTLDLSSLQTYDAKNGSWNAIVVHGANSRLILSGMQVLKGSTRGIDELAMGITASYGGYIDLSGLTTMRYNLALLATDANSVIDLSSLPAIDGSGTYWKNPLRLTVQNGGEILLPNVISALDTSFFAYGGSIFDLQALQTYSTTTSSLTYIKVQGMGSKLDFSGLKSLMGQTRGDNTSDYASTRISAIEDGILDFSSIETIKNSVTLTATSGGSIPLTVLTRTEVSAGYFGPLVLSFTISDHGSISMPNLLTAIDTNFYAHDGLEFDLGSVQTLARSLAPVNVVAEKSGTKIDLSSVTVTSGSLVITAKDGGLVDLSQLQTFSSSSITATGVNSTINLSSLATWYGPSFLTVKNGGKVYLDSEGSNLTSCTIQLDTQASDAGVIVTGPFTLDANSTIKGRGEIQGNLLCQGTITAGDSTAYGTLTVSGNCSLAATSKLNIGIAGRTAGFQYNQLMISGLATLSGTLALTFNNGFVPLVDDRFDVVFYGNNSGQFTALTGIDLGGGRTLKAIYRPNRLVLGERAGLITPAIPVLTTPRNVPLTYDLTPHKGYAAQPSWSIAPSDTTLYTAMIDENQLLIITPEHNEYGTAAPTLTLTDLSDGYSDVQDLDLTVQLILPTPPIPYIFPAGNPMDTDNLVCGLQPGTVGPGCSTEYRYTWTNTLDPACGPECPALTPKTVVNGPKADVVDILDASNTSPHEIWTCTVHTYDGQYYSTSGGVAQSGVIQALNTSTLTLSALPSTVTLGGYITLSGGITPVVGTVPVLFDDTEGPAGTTGTKPQTINTNANSAFSFTFLPDQAGSWAFAAKWLGDRLNFGDSDAAGVTVLQAQPTLSVSLSASAIAVGESVTATAVLSASLPDALKPLLSGLPVQLFMRQPDGTPAGPVLGTTDAVGVATFEPSAFSAAGVSFTQPGTWQFLAEFSGNNNFLRTTSSNYDAPETPRLTVKDGAGYAVVCVGALNDELKAGLGEGQKEHTKTADFVYRSLRERGFATDDIYYLREGPVQPAADIYVSDTTPSQGDVQAAIEEWALDKMNEAPGPLYVVLIDHGSEDAFYVYSGSYNETRQITPLELDSYLDTLQGGLAGTAAEEDLVVVVGACHSGSFMDEVSGDHRIILTSTAPEEISHRGVKNPLNVSDVRDGEPFVTELFRNAKLGKTLKESFEIASLQIEEYTLSKTNGIGRAFEPQHPQLDDNGDGVSTARPELSVVSGHDGAYAHEVILGFGANAGEGVGWIDAARTLVAGPGDPVELYARATEVGGDYPAWVEVKTPSYDGAEAADPSLPEYQQVLNLPQFDYESGISDLAQGIYRWSQFGTVFDAPGTYQVYYYIKTELPGGKEETSAHLLTTVYRLLEGNQPPSPVELTYPEDGAEVPTYSFFAWTESVDPEGDPVKYRVEFASDVDFTQDLVVQRDVVGTFTQVEGLPDGVTRYWRVIPVDQYGASPVMNEVRTVDLDNNNPTVPGWVTGRVTDEVTGSGIAGVTVRCKLNSVLKGTTVTDSRGDYFRGMLGAGYYTVEAEKAGYVSQSKSAPVYENEETGVDFALRPENAPFKWGEVTGDGITGTLDGSLLQQWVIGLVESFPVAPEVTYPLYPPQADVSGDGAVRTDDAYELLRWKVRLISALPADTNGDGYGPEAKAAPAKISLEQTTRQISIPGDLTVDPGEEIDAGVWLDDGTGLHDYYFNITYDAAVLEYVSTSNGTLTAFWAAPLVNAQPGRLRMNGYDVQEPSGAGTVVVLRFRALAGTEGQSSALHFDAVELNGTHLPSTATDGLVTVTGGLPSEGSPSEGSLEGEGSIEGMPEEGQAEGNAEGEVEGLPSEGSPEEGEGLEEGQAEGGIEGELTEGAEGEILEGVTEGYVEGEQEGEDIPPFSCQCNKSGFSLKNLQHLLGDFFIGFLSVMVLLAWRRAYKP